MSACTIVNKNHIAYRTLHRIGRILGDLVSDNLLLDSVGSCGIGQELGMAGLVEAVEEKSSFIDSASNSEETGSIFLLVMIYLSYIGMNVYIPVVLQNANHILLAQCIGNSSTFLLCQSNTTVVIVNALFSKEVASIYFHNYLLVDACRANSAY